MEKETSIFLFTSERYFGERRELLDELSKDKNKSSLKWGIGRAAGFWQSSRTRKRPRIETNTLIF